LREARFIIDTDWRNTNRPNNSWGIINESCALPSSAVLYRVLSEFKS